MATSLKELIVTYQANAAPVLNALRTIDAKIQHTTQNLRTSSEAFTRLGREIGLTLSLPIALLGISSVKAVADIQSLEASLTSVLEKFNTGLPIEQAITNEMKFLKDTANELGQSIQAIQKPYVQYLASSNDSLEVTRATIKSFLGLSTALGLTAPQTELVVKALSQMQSKGRITAEELRGQLGDSVPGAVQLFAAAMGKTVPEFTKLMETGQISSDVIAEVALTIEKKYGAAVAKGAQGIRANVNRIANAFYMLRVSVGKGLDESFKINEKMSKFANWLNMVADNFSRLDASGKKVILTIGLLLAVIGPALIAIGALLNIIRFAAIGFSTLLIPIRFLINLFPMLLGAIRAVMIVFAANPLTAFIAATVAIIYYWKDIVQLFKQAADWISQISFSGAFDKFKNFIGIGSTDISAGARDSVTTPNMTQIPANNQKSLTNNLTVNIPVGMTASDSISIKNAIKTALAEENRQAYLEASVQ